jgi:hypothetical protein
MEDALYYASLFALVSTRGRVVPARAIFGCPLEPGAGGQRGRVPALGRLATFLSAATYERIRTRWRVTVRGAAPVPWSRNSTRSRRSAKPARPSPAASATRAGYWSDPL